MHYFSHISIPSFSIGEVEDGISQISSDDPEFILQEANTVLKAQLKGSQEQAESLASRLYGAKNELAEASGQVCLLSPILYHLPSLSHLPHTPLFSTHPHAHFSTPISLRPPTPTPLAIHSLLPAPFFPSPP